MGDAQKELLEAVANLDAAGRWEKTAEYWKRLHKEALEAVKRGEPLGLGHFFRISTAESLEALAKEATHAQQP